MEEEKKEVEEVERGLGLMLFMGGGGGGGGRRAKGGLPCLLHQSTILWYTSVPRNVRYVGERENER